MNKSIHLPDYNCYTNNVVNIYLEIVLIVIAIGFIVYICVKQYKKYINRNKQT